jgi:hypothetical protein
VPKFSPSSSSLPPIDDLLKLADSPPENISNISDDLGWTWDDRSKWYLNDGEPITWDEMKTAIDDVRSRFQERIDEATDTLLNGGSLATWENAIALIIVELSYSLFNFGLGSESNGETIGDRIRTQLEYLRGFAEAIGRGELTDVAIRYRASMYSLDAANSFYDGQDAAHPIDEYQSYRNVLGGGEQHCGECPRLTYKGWVKRDSLPAIGRRQCMMFCKCHLEYRKQKSSRQSLRYGFVDNFSMAIG